MCVFTSGSGRYLPRVPVDGPSAGDRLSVSRTLCGALIFPSIASLVGRLLFGRMPSNLQRTVLVSISTEILHNNTSTALGSRAVSESVQPEGKDLHLWVEGRPGRRDG